MTDATTCAKITVGGIVATTVAVVGYNAISGGEEAESSSRFPDPTVYEFNRGDDEICRANFRELEEWYKDSYEGYRKTERDNNEMYEKLLETLSENRVELVDNESF